MPRPKQFRRVRFEPDVTYYKPRGVPMSQLEQVDLSIDELEAMRLSNNEGLKMDEACVKMEVSKATFQRILSSAYKKITNALISGKAIKILTNTTMPNQDGTGPEGKGPQTGRKMGPCSKDQQTTDERLKRGRGQGCGMGRGRGRA